MLSDSPPWLFLRAPECFTATQTHMMAIALYKQLVPPMAGIWIEDDVMLCDSFWVWYHVQVLEVIFANDDNESSWHSKCGQFTRRE